MDDRKDWVTCRYSKKFENGVIKFTNRGPIIAFIILFIFSIYIGAIKGNVLFGSIVGIAFGSFASVSSYISMRTGNQRIIDRVAYTQKGFHFVNLFGKKGFIPWSSIEALTKVGKTPEINIHYHMGNQPNRVIVDHSVGNEVSKRIVIR